MVGRNTNKWYYDSIPVFALNNRQKKDNIYHTKGGIDILTIVVKSHKNVPKSAMKETFGTDNLYYKKKFTSSLTKSAIKETFGSDNIYNKKKSTSRLTKRRK